MSPRAEDFLRQAREALARAAECERTGEEAKAWAHNTIAARWIASALRYSA